jgi:hypothetical protein
LIKSSRTTRRSGLNHRGMINIIGKNQKFNSSIRLSGSGISIYFFISAGLPTAVGKPAAIQSWIRLGGSIQYENHILFIDFLPTLIAFL